LTPIPGVSQRRRFIALSTIRAASARRHVRSSSRWKTATGPEVPLAQPRRELLGDHDRAVVAARAADRDRQPRLALARCRPGSRSRGSSGGRRGTRSAIGWRGRTRGPGRSGPTAAGALDVVRVLHEPDVEHEVGLERDAVLEAEADQLDRERSGRRVADLVKSRSRSSRSDRSLVSRTTSASLRTGSSRRARRRSSSRSRAGRRADGGGASPRSAG
jgi:hypothetical protein